MSRARFSKAGKAAMSNDFASNLLLLFLVIITLGVITGIIYVSVKYGFENNTSTVSNSIKANFANSDL